MSRHIVFLWIAAFFLCSSQSWASGEGEVGATELSAQPPSSSKIVGSIEVRPSWESSSSRLFSENAIELGYQFSPNVQLAYLQEFQNAIRESNAAAPNLFAKDGFLHTHVNDVWMNKDLGLALSLESRIYFPTNPTEQERGLIMAFRNYLKLRKEIGGGMTISAMEVPIVYSYSKPGALVDGKPDANPVFENRFYLVFDIALTPRLALSVPLIFHSARHSAFKPGAKHDSAWAHMFWIYPELTYLIAPNLFVGVAFYSQNLISERFSSFTIGSGLEKGVGQLIVKAFL